MKCSDWRSQTKDAMMLRYLYNPIKQPLALLEASCAQAPYNVLSIEQQRYSMSSTFDCKHVNIVSYFKEKVKTFDLEAHYTFLLDVCENKYKDSTYLSLYAAPSYANGECLMLCKQRVKSLDALFLKLIHVRVQRKLLNEQKTVDIWSANCYYRNRR